VCWCNSWRGLYIFMRQRLKQVPSCEFQSYGGGKNNVMEQKTYSSRNTKMKWSVGGVFSTDKAVYPINAMGNFSKAMMEKVMVAKSRNVDPNTTVICGTTLWQRDGNQVFRYSFVCWTNSVLVQAFDHYWFQTWRAYDDA